MHYQLLLVGNEHRYSMLFRKKLKRPLGHLCSLFDLLEATKVQRGFELGQGAIEVDSFLLNLVSQKLDLLLKALNLVFFQHYVMVPLLLESFPYLFHSPFDSEVEVSDFIEEERLEEFHLSFNVSEVPLVDLIQDP